MVLLRRGRYQVRLADTGSDLRRAQQLRWLAFLGAPDRAAPDRAAPDRGDLDRDALDTVCRHVLVEEADSGALVCCYRLMLLRDGTEIAQSYSAQHYDLSGLSGYDRPMLEMGRFCIRPGRAGPDPDILRLAWAAMARIVDETGARMMFGCSSFAGTDAAAHLDAFAMLRERHLAPRRWLPRVKAPDVFRFAQKHPGLSATRAGLAAMPPLLRTYLMMGGWVSDHAVVDRDLNTLHVFTGLEVAAIPPARVRALQGLAAG